MIRKYLNTFLAYPVSCLEDTSRQTPLSSRDGDVGKRGQGEIWNQRITAERNESRREEGRELTVSRKKQVTTDAHCPA